MKKHFVSFWLASFLSYLHFQHPRLVHPCQPSIFRKCVVPKTTISRFYVVHLESWLSKTFSCICSDKNSLTTVLLELKQIPDSFQMCAQECIIHLVSNIPEKQETWSILKYDDISNDVCQIQGKRKRHWTDIVQQMHCAKLCTSLYISLIYWYNILK